MYVGRPCASLRLPSTEGPASMPRHRLPKAGAASSQLANVSGVTADESQAAFLAGRAEAERVAATSQPTPSHKPLMISQHRRTRIACRLHAPRVPVSRSRVCARCLSPGDAAESHPPSRVLFAQGSGAGWFRPHHLPQVSSVELVSRFWRLARPAVFERLPFSAVLWLPEGVHSRPSRDPGGPRREVVRPGRHASGARSTVSVMHQYG